MIKFFRKIRQRLLAENKFSKYLLYAVGEIVLVVIGILIALQINNWNQERNHLHTVNSIFAMVSEDLLSDINKVEEIIMVKNKSESAYQKILSGQMTSIDYQKYPALAYLITGGSDLSITTRGFELLSNLSSTSESSNDSLQIRVIQFYVKHLNQIHVDDAVRSNDIENNITDWKNTYYWYADYIMQRNLDGFIEYSIHEQDYRNRVANYYLLNYTIYLPVLNNFVEEAKVLREKINSRVEI